MRIRAVSIISFFLYSVILIFLFSISFWTYYSAVSYKSNRKLSKNILLVVVQIGVSIFSVKCANWFIYFIKCELWKKTFFLFIEGVFFVLLYSCNQMSGNKGTAFGYGFFASRVYIEIVILVESGFIVFHSLLLNFVRKRILKISIPKFIFLCFVVIFLGLFYCYYQYISRRSFNKRGILHPYSDSYDPTLSRCTAPIDVTVLTRFKPRFFLHLFLFHTFFCKKDKAFTNVISLSGNNSKVELHPSHRKGAEKCKVEKYPILNTYTEDMFLDKTWIHTNLQKYFLEKIIVEEFDPEDGYIWNSRLFETILVRCGKDRNIVVSPKKRTEKPESELIVLSKESPNIIFLWFDCATRKTFEKDFPQTIRYLRNVFYRDSPNEFDFFEFFNNNVVGKNTPPQFKVHFWGQNRDLVEDPLWKIAQEKGYVSVYSDDECNESCSRYNNKKIQFEYQHLEPFCSPEYTDIKYHFTGEKGPGATARRCLYQKEAPEYVFEYLKKLSALYPKNSKFMLGKFNEGHEGTMESIQYVDRYLKNFFEWLFQDPVMRENTMVYMFGDHGNHASFLYLGLEGRLLRWSPAMYFFAHKSLIREEQRVNLRKNQHRLVNAFDWNHSWRKLIKGPTLETPEFKKYDLFNEEVRYDRTCRDAQISRSRCFNICKNFTFTQVPVQIGSVN